MGISKWALNEHNKGLWTRSIVRPGDTVIFHSSKESGFTSKAVSSILGFGFVGEGAAVKHGLWWIQEVQNQENRWPYVVPFKEIYLFSDITQVDLSTSVDKKSSDQMRRDIDLLLAGALPLSELEQAAFQRNPECPHFPVNGSVSRINETYEQLILERSTDLLVLHSDQSTVVLERRLNESIDDELATLNKEELFAQAPGIRQQPR